MQSKLVRIGSSIILMDILHVSHSVSKWIKMFFFRVSLFLKWNETLHITSDSWKLYCSTPFFCSYDVSLRWFQYQLLHRIIPTNNYLYTVKVVFSNLCTFCLICTESIQEFVLPLQFLTKNLEVSSYVFKRAGFHIDLKDISVVLFGENCAREVNLILILLKRCIFYCKKVKTIHTVNGSLFFQNSILLCKSILHERIYELLGEMLAPWFNSFHF